jgi:hypothetical protein
MMKPLTTAQKIVAFSSLFFVFCATLFGLFTIWLIITEY